MTMECLATARSFHARSFRRTHLDCSGGAAAVTRGIVHVLDIGLRQHVFAGRYRAHHIGHREHRLVAGAAIDSAADAKSVFRVAYVVRAVSPGKYVLPQAYVEDMYTPSRYGRTGTGNVEVRSAK